MPARTDGTSGMTTSTAGGPSTTGPSPGTESNGSFSGLPPSSDQQGASGPNSKLLAQSQKFCCAFEKVHINNLIVIFMVFSIHKS